MEPLVGDLLTEGVDEVETIQHLDRRPRLRIGRRVDREPATTPGEERLVKRGREPGGRGRKAFRERDRELGRQKYEEVLEKYFAAGMYPIVKRWVPRLSVPAPDSPQALAAVTTSQESGGTLYSKVIVPSPLSTQSVTVHSDPVASHGSYHDPIGAA